MSTGLARRVKRLAEEKKLLHDNFGESVHWIDPTAKEPKVEVEMTSKREKRYIFRVYIPEDFPNSCPKLAVIWPKRLCRHNGDPLPENCQQYRTLEFYDGFYTICYFHAADWCCGIRLYQAFTKGGLWMEAYESHLGNGKSVDHYLRRYSQPAGEPSDDITGFSWSTTPQIERRLTEEKQSLDEFCPGRAFTWSRCGGNHMTVDVEISTANENVYKLRAYLLSDYPNSCPILAVISPENLRCKDGRPLPENSWQFHTLDKRDGKITICHYLPNDWTDSIPLSNVFTKGELWVKAYESYLVKNGVFQTHLNEHVQSSD